LGLRPRRNSPYFGITGPSAKVPCSCDDCERRRGKPIEKNCRKCFRDIVVTIDPDTGRFEVFDLSIWEKFGPRGNYYACGKGEQ